MVPHGTGTPVDQVIEFEGLPDYVRERWPAAVAAARRKVDAAKLDPAAPWLLQAFRRASTTTQRIVWLHRAASAWAGSFASAAACREGCSHCCHIPVSITTTEARLLGRAAGRAPAVPRHAVSLNQLQDLEALAAAPAAAHVDVEPSPCPFLQDDRCSVYAARPMACRVLLNLDDDDLLCRLVPGVQIPVPYAASTQLKALHLMAEPDALLADIREFFPSLE